MNPRPSRKILIILATIIMIGAGGALLAWMSSGEPGLAGNTGNDSKVKKYFELGVILLHAKQYQEAAVMFDEVINHAPAIPEAHVNRGFSFLGQNRVNDAALAFNHAISIRPMQANAYYGLALCHEMQSDIAAALGAMRTFIHLSDGKNPYLPKARSAIWEWEQQKNTATGTSSGTEKQKLPARQVLN